MAEILQDRDFRVWIDEGELIIGDPIIDRIAGAIAEVNIFLVIISESFLASNWCRKELSLALTGQLDKASLKIFPVCVNSAPIPEAIKDTYYLNLDSKNLENIALKIIEAARRRERGLQASPPGRSDTMTKFMQSPTVAFTDEELSAMKTVGAMIRIVSGEILYRRGDESTFVMLITRGSVKIEVGSPPRTTSKRRPGQMVGEWDLLLGGKRSASATATKDVEGSYVSGNNWAQFLYDHPRALYALMKSAEGLQVVLMRHMAKLIGDLIDAGLALKSQGARGCLSGTKN